MEPNHSETSYSETEVAVFDLEPEGNDVEYFKEPGWCGSGNREKGDKQWARYPGGYRMLRQMGESDKMYDRRGARGDVRCNSR